MPRNVTGATKLTSASDAIGLLDAQNARYKMWHFSPSFAKEDLDREISRLGLGLLEAVPLDVPGRGIILAIIPSSLAVQVEDFAKLLEVRAVSVPDRDEISRQFPSTDAASHIPPLPGVPGLECFLSPLIGRQPAVGFFLESRNTLLTMETREFRRILGNILPIPVPTRPRYRAYATPGRKANEHCILGISLESPDFRTPKLVTITEWIRNHYERCTVMLGDGLHRITLQLDSNFGEDDALEYSKWIARDFLNSQSAVFTMRECCCEFDFKFCADVLTNDPRYPSYYGQVCSLFAKDAGFQDSCRAFARDFLRRRPQREESSEKHIDMSTRYLLEELAVISCLAEGKPCSFIYPGSLTILEEIAQGKHPGVPAPLHTIDYVELKLKNRENREE
jgi:tRNA-dependent cyclodipeptide synthase